MITRFCSLLTAVFLLSFNNVSATSYWQAYSGNISKDNISPNKTTLSSYQLYTLDVSSFADHLKNAPERGIRASSNVIASFPSAEGTMEAFRIYRMSNMDPALAAAYPEIQSFVGKGINNESALIYFSVSPLGVQTMLLQPDKPTLIIEPYTLDKNIYAVYRKIDRTGLTGSFECTMKQMKDADVSHSVNRPNADDGNYRTYRLALSVTGEYTAFFGGTTALALAAINATMTRVNGVFEVDFGIHMNLIANNTAIIYTNAASDPYSNASSGASGAWNQQVQTTLTNVIGSANYDIGHLFGASGGGGNAGCIACVCVNPTAGMPLAKGSAFTSPADAIPQGDNFDIDYVAHEMGHQFGGNHTFTMSNEGTIAQTEPGSGSTIMGYAGITGSTDVQPHSDAYFHAVSIQQITNYVKTTSCQVNTASGNAVPTADAGLDYTIPRGTPFALTGIGTDANDVGLSYCWEQMNVGSPATTFPSVNNTTGVAFRSFTPTSSPVRYFPRLSTIQAGATSWTWEAVPNVARTMSFRFTVRDNHAGGPANNSDDMVVTVSSASGPFVVTAPNTALTWAGGSSQTVTWNVASSNLSPVNCANVKISLSTDGGNTFPTVLLASTPNDGSEMITVPNSATPQARIKVEAVGNIFFDMSNVNFTISASAGLTTITTSAISPLSYCQGAAVSVPFTTNAAANAGNVFTAQLSNASGSFASPVNIGTLSSTGAGTIAATIPVSAATGTGYRIRVVSSNPGVTGSANTADISINALPVVSISGDVTFCQGSSEILTASSGAFYQWSTGATTQSINVNTQNTFTVTVTNAAGCSASSSASTTVHPLPVVSFNGLSANYQVTSPAATLTGNPGGGTFNGPGISGNTFSPSAAGVGTHTIIYNYTDGNSCSSSSSQQTTVSNCTTVPTRPGSIATAGGAARVCPGETKTYSVAAVSGATSYTWTPPAGGSITNGAGTNSVTIFYTSGYTATGTLTVVANNACGSSLSRTLTITRNNPATPSVITGTTAGLCNQNAIPYSVVNVAGITYNWSFSVAAPVVASGQGSNAITANFPPAFTGSASLRVTASNACGTSAQRSLTVKATPATPPSITGTAAPCANQVGVPYSISPIVNATSYTWSVPAGARINDGSVTSSSTTLTTSATSVTVNFASTAGNVRARGNNACGSGSYLSKAVSFVCRQADISNVKLACYPVPADDDLAVIFTAVSDGEAVISITDILGKKQLSYAFNRSEGRNEMQLDISGLHPGIYILEVAQGSKKESQRIIIK